MKGAYLRRGELRAAGPNFVDVSLRRVEYPSYFRSHHCGGLPTCRPLLFFTPSQPVTPPSVIFSNLPPLFTRFRHQDAFAQALPSSPLYKTSSPLHPRTPPSPPP